MVSSSGKINRCKLACENKEVRYDLKCYNQKTRGQGFDGVLENMKG